MSAAVVERLASTVRELPEPLQLRVLEFAQALSAPRSEGIPGRDLLRFAGRLKPEVVDRMAAVIETECERVDPDEWRVPA